MNIDGPTSALILSILGFMATLFLYKLGNDVKKHRRKKELLTVTTESTNYACNQAKDSKDKGYFKKLGCLLDLKIFFVDVHGCTLSLMETGTSLMEAFWLL